MLPQRATTKSLQTVRINHRRTKSYSSAKGLEGCIIHASRRNTPLTETEKAQNKEWSKTRTRVEHIFGMQLKKAGTLIVRAVKIHTSSRNHRPEEPQLQYDSFCMAYDLSKGSTVSEVAG